MEIGGSATARRSSGVVQQTAYLRQTAVVTVPHAGTMCRASETPFERIESAIRELPRWLAAQSGAELGDAIVRGRQVIDRIEAVNGEATRRFEKAGGYRADGSR